MTSKALAISIVLAMLIPMTTSTTAFVSVSLGRVTLYTNVTCIMRNRKRKECVTERICRPSWIVMAILANVPESGAVCNMRSRSAIQVAR